MRSSVAALTVAAVTLLTLAAVERCASAYEFRLLAASDLLFTTGFSPAGSPAPTADTPALNAAELGLTIKSDILSRRLDFHEDFWGRMGFDGTGSAFELRALSLTIKDLGGHVDLVVGRFHLPGGFWLIADGAMVRVRFTDWIDASVYGGLRSFTTARRNADMSLNPMILPVAGGTLAAHNRWFDASVSFTYTQDSIDFPSCSYECGTATPDNPFTLRSPFASSSLLEQHAYQPEFFLDAQLSIFPTDNTYLAGGASFGSRYDVQFNAMDPSAAVNLGYATLGSTSAWAMGEWRPNKRLRFIASVNYEVVQVFQSQLLGVKPDGTFVQAANGNFEDNSIKGILRIWRSLRAELEYRLRFRENTDIENHIVAGLRGDRLVRALGAFASIGVDLNSDSAINATTKLPNNYNRVIYSAGLSFVMHPIDVRAGILYTDGIGSGLVFSQNLATASGGGTGAQPTELFPYVLESNRIAFLRVFANYKQVFLGIDLEMNTDLFPTTFQMRGLFQLGVAL